MATRVISSDILTSRQVRRIVSVCADFFSTTDFIFILLKQSRFAHSLMANMSIESIKTLLRDELANNIHNCVIDIVCVQARRVSRGSRQRLLFKLERQVATISDTTRL